MSVFAMKKNIGYRPIEHRMPFVTLENVTGLDVSANK
jgi:hypothetical protein